MTLREYATRLATLTSRQLVFVNDCLLTTGLLIKDDRFDLPQETVVVDEWGIPGIEQELAMFVDSMIIAYKWWTTDDVKALAVLLGQHGLTLLKQKITVEWFPVNDDL